LKPVVDRFRVVDEPVATTALATVGASLKPGVGALAAAVAVRRNVLGPRETHVRSSPRCTVKPLLTSS
jgi:hypothetical protein